MDLVKRAYSWRETHRDSFVMAGLRVLLGLIFIIKGVLFISDTTALQQLITTSRFEAGSVIIAHYIAMIHLTGGLLIAMGAITRIAVLFQLPIVIGAILFNAQDLVLTLKSELLLSIAVLILSLVILFFGSGIYSADRLLKQYDSH